MTSSDKRKKRKKQHRHIDDLSLWEYALFETVLGLLDLAIFILIIKAGVF